MVKTELDFISKCRTCFSEEQEMHDLFVECDQGLSLSDILRSTTFFAVEENDGLSPYLCKNCTTVVIDFFNFKSIYQENEKYIRSLISEQIPKNIATYTKKDDNEGQEHETRACFSEYDECSDPGDIVETEINEVGDTIIEVFNDDSFPIDTEENQNIEVAAGFVEPQTILMNEMICDINVTEYIENAEVLSIKYLCDKCGDSFLIKSGFQQHMLRQHKVCLYEFEKYASKVPKLSNLDIKDENIALQCHICNDEFKTRVDISEHYKAHKKYICEHCGAAFLKKSYLDDHSEVHTTEKRHICPICGKAFRRRTVLVKHKRLHTHPRQCVCEMCGLRFNDKGTLNTHIKLKHTKERNFNCTICGLWFPLKSTLEKHIFRHNENRDKEFICTECNMAYRDKSSLNRHVIIKHTGSTKKPSCTYCGKQYTTNTNLLKHIRKHHIPMHIKKESDGD